MLLYNSTAKAYLCNQGGTVSLFLSRPACHILNLADKHSITLIPVYILTHLIVEANYLSQGKLVPEWHFLLHKQLSSFRINQGWIFWLPHIPISVSFITLWTTIASRSYGVECLQPSMEVSGELCISSSHVNSCSVVQVPSETCHKSIQTSYSSGTMLDGGSLAFHSSHHVGRHSSLMSHHKVSHHECFSRPGAQGSAIYAFHH